MQFFRLTTIAALALCSIPSALASPTPIDTANVLTAPMQKQNLEAKEYPTSTTGITLPSGNTTFIANSSPTTLASTSGASDRLSVMGSWSMGLLATSGVIVAYL